MRRRILPPMPSMPAPEFDDKRRAVSARTWTVTLERNGKHVEKVVADSVEPTWEGPALVFRNAAGDVVAQFTEDEVVGYQ